MAGHYRFDTGLSITSPAKPSPVSVEGLVSSRIALVWYAVVDTQLPLFSPVNLPVSDAPASPLVGGRGPAGR